LVAAEAAEPEAAVVELAAVVAEPAAEAAVLRVVRPGIV
jgi:hypothetical protein